MPTLRCGPSRTLGHDCALCGPRTAPTDAAGRGPDPRNGADRQAVECSLGANHSMAATQMRQPVRILLVFVFSGFGLCPEGPFT